MEKSPQPPLLFRCWATKPTSTSDIGCRLGEIWRREMRNLRYPPQLNKSFRGDVEFPGGCDFRHFNTHIWPARFCNVKKPRILDLSGLESAPGFSGKGPLLRQNTSCLGDASPSTEDASPVQLPCSSETALPCSCVPSFPRHDRASGGTKRVEIVGKW